ncbi:putative NAD(P)/FAD-binding protein YdhS [Arthrobacter sp. PvP102]|uniref:FAD/NAD(P)-binding protein n=1 Tax=unclassified Arthrobacter TaxID=235627 RepID=UPI001AE1A108|nr:MULTISPECIES: FAD/NAD(P)-binding protein [unclassified Arthrobacter]MBP1234218.1 putative NAD(P)/FAD-binding protein YdhS [Arthrobacter sp. PvP103]MBP1239352.1 putative NAD(P)/FAD-binding protein YdhS [Arthrobacter sp. PvP102]
MGTSQNIRTVLIGAGPRGTSVLERLLANWRLRSPSASGPSGVAGLHIDVVDPYPAGPGHVWQPGQSRLYLMNTQSFYPTVIPEDPELAAPVAGCTFDQWREARQDSPDASLTEDEQAELSALGSRDFPSRALYGRYLSATLDELLAHLPEGVTVQFHRTTATSVRPAGNRMFDVELGDGGPLTAGSVVLALGHLESRLNAEQRELQAGAGQLGLLYLPPAVPADVDWSVVPAGQPVLVRGMGLNFFDVMGQLTEGRGGKFVATAADGSAVPGQGRAGLEYIPSGDEPLIVAASRRGTPYRAKANLAAYYPSGVTLRYCTEAAVGRFAAAGITPGFDHDLWPLMQRDALWAYYATLVRTRPDAVTEPDAFLALLQEVMRPHAHSVSHWEAEADALVAKHVAPDQRLNLPGLAAPLAGRSFASQAEVDAAVVEYLLDDARRSALGEDDPVKMAIGALHHGRAVLKTAVADGGITDESWVAGLRGWFESFVEGLASGPPAIRAEQLAALARAGVVSFVGPDPKFSLDRAAGTFSAASPWVKDGKLRARAMIEALAPANRVSVNVSPVLEQLLADGLVRPRLMMRAEGAPVETSGLDVSPHPYRPVGANGSVTEGLYVLGLQLSAAQWGTAIAAEARPQNGPVYRSGQRTLRDADEIARHILDH